MANPSNLVTLTGRTTKAIKFFDNQDGSKKGMMTLACDRNFPNRDGEYGTDFVEVELFVPATGKGPIAAVVNYINPGDRIQMLGSIRSSVYQKDGENVFKQAVVAENITLLETKATSEAHKIAAEAKAAAAATAAATTLPVVGADAVEGDEIA